MKEIKLYKKLKGELERRIKVLDKQIQKTTEIKDYPYLILYEERHRSYKSILDYIEEITSSEEKPQQTKKISHIKRYGLDRKEE